MPVHSLRYVVENYCWEVFSGRNDEAVISGWLVADTPPSAMTIETDKPGVSFPIPTINLPSFHLGELMGPRAANARFHAVVRVGKKRPDLSRSRLVVEFGRSRRAVIDIGEVFDNGIPANNETIALLSRCESLGDSCEFGFVQRKFGVDQLGLFRFTGSGDPIRLAEAIRADFEGFAEGDDLEAGELLGEWVVKSRRYEFILHTGRFPYAISEADIRRKESVKLRYLARKFLEDLADAEKTFIRRVEGGDERGMLELFGAMRERGPNRMVWVTRADDANPHGTLREVEEGLFRGYIESLAPLDRALENNPEQWLDLIRRLPGM